MMLSVSALAASAQVNYKVQTACHPQDVKHYDTERLRSSFMMEKVMAPDEINVTYTLYDRLIYGGAMPVNKVLKLETFRELGPEITCPAFVFGSIASSITGSGNSIDSKITGCWSSQMVSPVVVNLKPTAAAMSPEYTISSSSLLFACI